MRDLTKSMLSFAWSMSVFGLAQAANLLVPRQAAIAFEDVTRCTEEQLGAVTRPIFNAGDRVQRGLIDLTFRVLGLDRFDCAACSGSRGTRLDGRNSGGGPVPPVGDRAREIPRA